MPNFSEVVEELTGSGYTPTEALQATVALSRIPQIDRLIKNPIVTDFVISMLLEGFKPVSDQQKVMIEGIATFSKREKDSYFMHTLEGMSFQQIADEFGIKKSTVQTYIERARRKLELQAGANEQRNAV